MNDFITVKETRKYLKSKDVKPTTQKQARTFMKSLKTLKETMKSRGVKKVTPPTKEWIINCWVQPYVYEPWEETYVPYSNKCVYEWSKKTNGFIRGPGKYNDSIYYKGLFETVDKFMKDPSLDIKDFPRPKIEIPKEDKPKIEKRGPNIRTILKVVEKRKKERKLVI